MKYQQIKSNNYQIVHNDLNKFEVQDMNNKTSATKGFVVFVGNEKEAINFVLLADNNLKK
jgi:hypothetical protein